MASSGNQRYRGAIVPGSTNRFLEPLLTCGADYDGMDSIIGMPQDSPDSQSDDESEPSPNARKPTILTSTMWDGYQGEHHEEPIEVSLSDMIEKEEEKPTFHPALKPAVLSEGQEALWVEDNVSTISSVFVTAPKPPQPIKKKLRFNFLNQQGQDTIPEDEEVEPEAEPIKIHVKKKKVKKAVVLLPQHGGNTETLVDENVKQEAAANMVKARQLLNQALIMDGTPRLADSENMARNAFAHAAAARRLMADAVDDGLDLDDVLSVLAEKGEHAAFEHQKIVLSQSFSSPKPQKQNMLSAATDYASKAMQYLESMLPTNVDREIQESMSQDLFGADSVSTLGFKTDTFEYQLNPVATNASKSFTNMDLMSISSLNEILDGPAEVKEGQPPSPRQALPVINVPNRTPNVEQGQAHDKGGMVVTTSASLLSPISEVTGNQVHAGAASKKTAEPRSRPTQHPKGTIQAKASALAAAHPKTAGKGASKKSNPQRKKWSFFGRSRKAKQAQKHVPERGVSPGIVQENLPPRHAAGMDRIEQRQSTGPPPRVPTEVAAEKPAVHKPDKMPEKHLVQISIPPKDVNIEGALPTIPSNSFDTDQQSRLSRYHSMEQASMDNKQQSMETDSSSQSTETQHRVKETKSDWDESLDWRNPGLMKKKTMSVIPAPSSAAKSGQVVNKSESDWDESHDPSKSTMTKKSIASLSSCGSEGEVSASHTSRRSRVSTERGEGTYESSDWDESVGTSKRSTKSAHTLQADHEVDTQADENLSQSERDVDSRDEVSESVRSGRVTEEGHDEVSASVRSGRITEEEATRYGDDEEQIMRERLRERLKGMVNAEEATQDGSLIDFVISPHRANIITPGGSRPFEREQVQPMKEIVPTLKPIGENGDEHEDSSEAAETSTEIVAVKSEEQRPHGPRLMARIATMFTGRRGQMKEEETNIDQQDSQDKGLEQAISDGNMKAFEANLNAEDAPSTFGPRPKNAHTSRKVKEGDSSRDQQGKDSQVGREVLESAITNAQKKAAEANLEAEVAPFRHRSSRRRHPHHKKEDSREPSSRVPHDLVDAIRMQAALEHKKNAGRHLKKRESRDVEDSNDAPGVSLAVDTSECRRKDPPKAEESSYRVLAPTPRKKRETSESESPANKCDPCDDKFDQRRVTELLYGGASKQTAPVTVKGGYIGDMLDDAVPSGVCTDPSSDDSEEVSHYEEQTHCESSVAVSKSVSHTVTVPGEDASVHPGPMSQKTMFGGLRKMMAR